MNAAKDWFLPTIIIMVAAIVKTTVPVLEMQITWWSKWKWVQSRALLVLLSFFLAWYRLWSTCIHGNLSRALHKVKGTVGRETGHICFDVFTLHKRRWQPLSASTHDAPGHFTFPSLYRIVTFFQKALKKYPQMRMHPLHLSHPFIPDQILPALWCHALFCFLFIPLKYETCQFLLKTSVTLVHCDCYS